MKIIDYKDLTLELAHQGCLVVGMPNEDYHSYEGVSKSGLDKVNQSPAHYMFDASEPSKRHLELGTALHTAILEPERYADEYMILKGIKARTASEYKQAVKVKGSELVLIEPEAAHIASIQEVIKSDSDCQDALADCDLFEVSAFIEVDGVLRRCRYDALSTTKHISVDIKTTQCSKREEFSKSVSNYRYHVQDAFYSDIYCRITGHSLEFKFLAVENKPPHCPMIYTLDNEARMIGADEAARNVSEYKRARESQEWKGYEQTNEPLSLPSWAIARYEDQLDGEIV